MREKGKEHSGGGGENGKVEEKGESCLDVG